MGTFNDTHRWLLTVLRTFIEEAVSCVGYNEDGRRMEYTPEAYGRMYGFAVKQAMEAYGEAQASYMAAAKAKAEVAEGKATAKALREVLRDVGMVLTIHECVDCKAPVTDPEGNLCDACAGPEDEGDDSAASYDPAIDWCEERL